MAQTSHLKAAQLTALDNYQPAGDQQAAGFGAPARLKSASGTIVPLANDNTTSTYQMVRVPSYAVLKHVWFTGQAQGAGTFDCSVYYSDSQIDGTPFAVQGLVVPTTGATFIADAVVNAAAVAQLEILGYGGTAAGWTPAMINKRLWDALALTTDPGGYFDIVLVCTDTAVTTGTGVIALSVEWAD